MQVKNDPTVTDLRALRYLPSGSIEYKLDFDDQWEVLPQRPKKVAHFSSWPSMYTEPLKITDTKWSHLQELKKVIPKEYHNFYDEIKKK